MKIYARLNENNEIVEYPVYDLHIRNRQHPIEWYTECIVAEKPIAPRFHFVKEKQEVFVKKSNNKTDRSVYISYDVVPQDLNNLLSSISKRSDGQLATIADLDQETVDRIIELADDYAENKLDVFASLKGYKNAERLAGYSNSTIGKFSTEANKLISLRDQIWIKLPEYMSKVITGVKPLPTSTADLDAEFPTLSWE
jgi:hypothetical protein